MNKITLEKNKDGKLIINGIPSDMLFENTCDDNYPILLKDLLAAHKNFCSLYAAYENTTMCVTALVPDITSGMKYMINTFDVTLEKCNRNAELLRRILDVWIPKHPPSPMALQLQAVSPVTFLESTINDICKELS